MPLDLRFKALPAIRIDAIQHGAVTRALQAITARNLAKETPAGEPKQRTDRKEKLKGLLRAEGKSVILEQSALEVGGQRILVSLYLEYASRPEATWLPKFDGAIADALLGASSGEWHAGRRRQATQLFFTHYSNDKMEASGLSRLCELLIDAYDRMESEGLGPVEKWRQHRKWIFSPAGHQDVAGAAKADETLLSLMERFAIPGDGRFAECLRQVFLLNAVRDCPVGKDVPALAEIESLKSEHATASLLLGAAALQIMVKRVAHEGGRKWSGEWSNWITRLGCDPRHGRSTAEGTKWWGWATPDELRLAQQGITTRDLRFFIEFLRQSLQGTDKEPQFALRSQFLLGLLDAHKIDSARLVLNWVTFERLDAKYRDVLSVAHLSHTSDDTSMICLKCTDDVFVIEGTHSFGLRMFHKAFPVLDFWERPRQIYQDRELRISPADCPLYLRHDQGGNWVRGFFRHLARRFHVEWGDVLR